MRVFVILPAAGIGTRMSSSSGGGGSTATPKQFLAIRGVPVLVHCLRAFFAVPRVELIYIAVRAQEIERVQALVAEHGLGEPGKSRVRVVEGGENRQHSVGNALAAVDLRDGMRR